jgi:hypothetical protein
MLGAMSGLVLTVRVLPLALLLLATGCSSGARHAKHDHDMLLIAAQDYPVAFDAAIEAARREGMPAALRDRRGGLIITEYRIAASLLEPWDTHGESFGQTAQNTLAQQRRRTRVEFVPAGPPPPLQQEAPEGVDLVPPLDLTRFDQPLEMHVRVFLERAYAPGQRRSTWTRSINSATEIVVPGTPPTVLPSRFWTPVSRDRDAEKRLIRAVDAAIGAASTETTDS